MSTALWPAFMMACALGATARYALDRAIQSRAAGPLPRGTAFVNLTGCLLLGAVAGLGLHHDVSPAAVTVVGTGFCGSYTTFSTFTVQTIALVEEAGILRAAGYVAGSTILGILAAGAGYLAVSAL